MFKIYILVFLLIICISITQAGHKKNPIDYKDWDSLKSPYAPVPYSSKRHFRNNPYVLPEKRLKEIRSQFMYWFWDQGGGDSNDGDWQKHIHISSPQFHKNLNFQLPFFGFRFNYTRVSMNGYLEFSDAPPSYSTYPLVFPVKDWPKQHDPSFIGIFYSKCRTGRMRADEIDTRKAGVYFRVERDLGYRTDKFGVELRERVMWDVREGIVGAETFYPKHAIIATWKNISFAGGIDNALFTTNTFQLVLATDEVFTYAIFNYLDLHWTSHTEAYGDIVSGEGGVPAFVGFNAGNGTRSYEYLPYSQTSVIRDLTEKGWGNGFKGRHIFRIDEHIIRGSCNKDIDGANQPLVFAPESGNMLGGTIVNITGPCFEPGDKIICRFDIEEVYGTVVDRNRAICIQPRMFVEGYVRLEIAIAPGKYKWKGRYFVETAATAAEKIFFHDYSVLDKHPDVVKILWNRYNLSTNTEADIQISLWGYRENSVKPEFLYIDQIATNVLNTGEYTIHPANFSNRDNRNVTDVKFGFLQINLTEPIPIEGTETKITPVIWSRPIPLAWYFAPQWEREHGNIWAEQICDNWLKHDKYLKDFVNELPPCPCTLQQALANKGRYLPDMDCDKDSYPYCLYNKGAVHCVRTGPLTLAGSEQQCCYDRNYYLMISHDQHWGSSPRRSHNLGMLPWNEATKVPTLSQWYNDIAPKYFCCMWQNSESLGCQTLRTERRPTKHCVSYQPPAIAGVYGDPHIITFDDVAYTFNGMGEFVLVRSNSKTNRLDIQARFEQMPANAYGNVMATQMTSIVARGNTSTTIEVRIRPPKAQWRYRLDVFADQKRIYFDHQINKFQHFPGVTVYTPTYILNQSEVLIMFDSGAGVEVIENNGYMTARVYLPRTYTNQVQGLFGNLNDNSNDEFVDPDAQLAETSLTSKDIERVYYDFGVKWRLREAENSKVGTPLFLREFGRTSAYYNNNTFKPEFKITPEEIIPANRSVQIDKAYQLCNNNAECLFDYTMTLDKDLALFTLKSKQSIIDLKESNKQIVSCGVLETPRHGRKSNFQFTAGTKVIFECDDGFQLTGDTERICTTAGQWNRDNFGYTECVPVGANASVSADVGANASKVAAASSNVNGSRGTDASAGTEERSPDEVGNSFNTNDMKCSCTCTCGIPTKTTTIIQN